jgi:hypothetical protein
LRILFDQGTPVPLRLAFANHIVATAYEQGWAELSNGDLLAAAEQAFDILLTTDRNLRHQQNLKGRRLAILILPTTSWPRLRHHMAAVVAEVEALQPGDVRELSLSGLK